MKKKIVVALLLSVSLLAAGCSNGETKQTETKKATEAKTEAGTEKNTEAKTEANSEAKSEKESESETEKIAERPDYTALDYVTLGEYKGIEVTLQKIEASDTEVDEAVQSSISQNGKLEEIKEGKVENADVVNLDYAGTLDGEAFDGGTAKGSDLTIGSQSFIEGFESGMIGMEIGETKDLEITMPENYQVAELAGKDVVFNVTVNSIKRTPELTDALVAEISDFKTVDEFRENLREELKEQKKGEQSNQEINDLITAVYEASKINDYPKEVVEFQLGQMKDYYEEYAEQAKQTLKEFVEANFQMTEDEFNTRMEENIKQGMAQEMLLKAIAETEKITITEAEYKEGAEKFLKDYGFATVEELEKQYGKVVIETSLVQDKVINILLDNAKVTNPEDKVEETTESESETEKVSEKGSEKTTEKVTEKSSDKETEKKAE